MLPAEAKKILSAYAQKGCLFHVSEQARSVLEPRQGDCRRSFTGNLRAVYATTKFSWAIGLVGAKRRLEDGPSAAKGTAHVHVCTPQAFTPVLGNQFVSFFPVDPLQIIPVEPERHERKKPQVTDRLKIPPRQDEFFEQVLEIYWDHVAPRVRNNELHGPAHAISTASVAYILARKECPRLVPEVIVGAFFHDIGRTGDPSGLGHGHGQRGAEILKSIMRGRWRSLDRARILLAVKDHPCGRLSRDKISACIWDADRLMMSRLRARISPGLLSTRTARQVAVLFNKVLDDQKRRHPQAEKIQDI